MRGTDLIGEANIRAAENTRGLGMLLGLAVHLGDKLCLFLDPILHTRSVEPQTKGQIQDFKAKEVDASEQNMFRAWCCPMTCSNSFAFSCKRCRGQTSGGGFYPLSRSNTPFLKLLGEHRHHRPGAKGVCHTPMCPYMVIINSPRIERECATHLEPAGSRRLILD